MVDGELVQAKRFGTSFLLYEIPLADDQCLRDLDEPIDLKAPVAGTLMLSCRHLCNFCFTPWWSTSLPPTV